MIYLSAVMAQFGTTRSGAKPQSGAQLGKHLIRCDFVETFQKMWRRHFKADLFTAEQTEETLLYNMLVALQVKLVDADSPRLLPILTIHPALTSIDIALCPSVCLSVSVCLSQVGVLSKRMNESSWFLTRELPSTLPLLLHPQR